MPFLTEEEMGFGTSQDTQFLTEEEMGFGGIQPPESAEISTISGPQAETLTQLPAPTTQEDLIRLITAPQPTPQEIKRAQLEEEKSQLLHRPESQDLIAQSLPAAIGSSGMQGLQGAIGGRVKGVGTAMAISPTVWGGGIYGGPPAGSLYEKVVRERIKRTPAEVAAEIQANPISGIGREIIEKAPDTFPVDPSREGIATAVAGQAGGFALLPLEGVFAPLTMGLEALGASFENDLKEARQAGLNEDAAARQAINRGIARGGFTAAVFQFMPKPLRSAGEKYIADKFGKDALSQFLAGRAVLGTEGAVIGATTAAGENIISERPVTEGMGAAAGGMAAVNLFLPYSRTRQVIDTARELGLEKSAAEVSKTVEPRIQPAAPTTTTTPEVRPTPPVEAPPVEVISKKTLMGRDQYRVKAPGIGGETVIMVEEGAPMETVQAKWAERWKEYQAAPEGPAVAPEGTAKAPEGAAAPPAPAKPEIAKLGTSGTKNPQGDPLGTQYYGTPEIMAEWEALQQRPITDPGVWERREIIKNMHGGNPPLRKPGEVAAPQSTTGTPYAGQIQGPVGVVGNPPAESPQTLAEGAPGGVRVPPGPRQETPETQKVGDQSALQRKEAETPVVPAEGAPTAPPPPPQPPAPPVITGGVGGAPPAPGATGIKNAEMNRVRAELGMPPLEETLGKPDSQLWSRVMDRLEREPGWQDRLIAELKDRPRGHTDEEALALDHRLVELRTEHARAANEAIKARDEGRIEDATEAGQRATAITDQIRELGDITKASGTVLGRALRSRQLMMNEDFSLAALELRKREANDWKPLTEEQRNQIQKTHDDYVKQTAELEAHVAQQTARAVDAEIKLAQAEAQKGPAYDPRLLKMVENVASFMDNQATAAMQRIRERMSGKRLMMDPTLGTADLALNIADASIIGAAKIARKVSDFAKWSDAMVRDLGDWIKPHLQTVWAKSQEQFEKTAEERLKKVNSETKARVKSAMAGATVEEQIQTAKDKIKAKIEKGETDSLFYSVQKLVRGLVSQNLKITREELIDTVHGIFKESMPNISRMEAMDAISGRGRFTVPAQDEVSKTVRDLKTQTRLEAHILDVESKKPLPRTGFQHGKLSDIARQMEQKLNEWKRKFGVVVTDPEAQLESVLSARKTYYRNRIVDLKTEIKKKERIVRTAGKTDVELERLKAEYEQLKKEHAEIFERQGLTNEQRIAIAEKAADRQIAALEEQIRTETVFPKTKKPSGITSAKLEAQRSRIADLKAERQWMRDRLQPKMDPGLRALQLRRAQTLRKIADYEQRMAEGDYAPRIRKPPMDITQDEYALKLMAQLEKTKRDFDKGLMLDEMAKRTKWQKVFAAGREVLQLPKAIWSAIDLSAVGRQGLFPGSSHPIKAIKSMGAMFKALSSEDRALVEEQRTLNRENAKNGYYARGKLYLPPLDEFRLSRQEEIMMSQFAQLIPGVKMSNRAFITYLNRLSAEVFDKMLEWRKSWFSKEVTTKDLESIANYINTARGRGPMGSAERSAETLASIFWSPRLAWSRFQMLAGHPMWRATPEVRAVIAVEYARSLAAIAAMVGLGAMAGASIETDPNSSDFLKLKFGNTRVDVFGGLIQNTVLLSRLVTGKLKTSEGKEVPARTVPTLGNFMRNKLTPALGITLDLRDILTGQKPPPGHPQTIGELAATTPVPLSFRDIYDLMLEQGVPAGTAFQILSIFGFGVQTYQDKQAQANAARQGQVTPVRRVPVGTQ